MSIHGEDTYFFYYCSCFIWYVYLSRHFFKDKKMKLMSSSLEIEIFILKNVPPTD